jgi:50S ribosomal subunit-associated GTPase HflX
LKPDALPGLLATPCFRVEVGGCDDSLAEFLKMYSKQLLKLSYLKKGDQLILDVFTKTDKLNQAELQKLKLKYPDGIFISNLKNKGIDVLESTISKYLFGK